jgi:hypothetical protein
MPEPRTTPNEHDKPVFQPTTPGGPTPEDPRQREPIHDPPVNPEQDPPGSEPPVRQAGGNPDNILFEEDRTPG